MTSPPERSAIDETARIRVRLTPKADRDAVTGIIDGVAQVRVRAAPSDSAANKALVRLLARAVGVPPSAPMIVGGFSSRRKLVQIPGISTGAAMERLQIVATRPPDGAQRCNKAKD